MKTKHKKKQRTKRPGRSITTSERMSSKIITDFLRFNVFCFLLLLFIYLFCYLAARQYNAVYNIIAVVFHSFLTVEDTQWLFDNSFVLVIAAYLVIFFISSFYYSISTLVNFDKTWRSLGAITSDEAEISKFSKNFSDVEIALKDIKLGVVRSQQAAAAAESRKNDLVMYLAHDLKTPLTSIIGYLSLLDESPELSTAQRAKYIGITLDKAYRLEQLINEFFEITRFNIESITLENNRIDLGMMLRQITDEFYPMFKEKNLSYDIDLKEKIMMYADADKIARVFDNLLKNAVNYSYDNSMIRIGARIVGESVVIKFRNKCDEIPPEKLERLFDKFFRADSSRTTATGGSGLGLAISKQIAELHGGSISAKSSVDHTDFTVVLPYKPAADTVDWDKEEEEE